MDLLLQGIKIETEKTHYPEPIEKTYEFKISKGQSPERLDQYLTHAVQNATRNKVQTAIEEKRVLVNGNPKKASYKIAPGDFITCVVYKIPPIELIPENIPLNIVYEDDYLLIVNKPAGMCVHPGIGNRYGTLINALLYHFGIKEPISFNADFEEDSDEEAEDENELTINFNNINNDVFNNSENRPGLVHRIDKDTTGLLVIAKTLAVHNHLSKQFANKTTEREYIAIVWGKPKLDFGRIESNMGRSPNNRMVFSVLEKGGKLAITDYKVLERFSYTSLLSFKLHTGRTHQIRVHSGSIGHKLFGDVRYSGNKVLFGAENPQWRTLAQKYIDLLGRQMLHAKTLGFIHPVTSEKMIFDSELPADMKNFIDVLRDFASRI